MKMRAEKKQIINVSVCVILVVAMVFFGMHLYKNGTIEEPQNPISQTIEPLKEDGEIEVGESLADKINSESENDNESSEIDEISESQADSKNDDSTNSDTNGQTEGTSQTPQNLDLNTQTDSNLPLNNSQESNVDSENNNENTSENIPSDITEDVKPDGTTADGEYFRTTISDGEKVYDRDFEFEIIQLKNDAKLRSQKVKVNNESITQFSGKCTLSEGENIIRVECTYTLKDNSVKRIYKDYTVHCYADEIGISTDLKDFSTNEEQLNFYANAFYNETKLDVNCTLNGKAIPGDEKYSVSLSEGENKIELSASYKGKIAKRDYTVTCEPIKEFQLVTDLSDKTVSNENFSFSAKLMGQSDRAKITVSLNGKSLRAADGLYSCTLKNGSNSIRIKATDGEKSIDKNFTITLVPKADEKTKPIISATNLTDGMTVKGSKFSLTLTGNDYNGQRIYGDKIALSLNGKIVKNEWQNSTETGYVLGLQGGVNEISICLTDSEGRFCDYYYTINCQKVSDGEEIGRVNVSLDAKVLGLDRLTQSAEIPFFEGENAIEVVKRFLTQNGFDYKVSGTNDSGYYISRISKAGQFAGGKIPTVLDSYLKADGIGKNSNFSNDSLGEFDYTQGSGWVYSINGKVASYGISQAHFSDGDTLRLTFSLCYGREISGAENSYDVVW